MIKINETNYFLCLIDTNVISNALRDFPKFLKGFRKKFDESTTIMCFSAFTISEMHRRPEILELFAKKFSNYPSAIIDGHESLFIKEKELFINNKSFNPILFCTHTFTENELYSVLTNKETMQRTDYWKDSYNDILTGILSLKENFPPKNKTYSKKEIEDFVFNASIEQIARRDNSFAKAALETGKIPLSDDFPSIQAQSYCTFYKFYIDKRKPISSDVYDILIFSVLPYIDFYITEGNLNEHIKQIQKRHDKLTNLKSFSIKEIQ